MRSMLRSSLSRAASAGGRDQISRSGHHSRSTSLHVPFSREGTGVEEETTTSDVSELVQITLNRVVDGGFLVFWVSPTGRLVFAPRFVANPKRESSEGLNGRSSRRTKSSLEHDDPSSDGERRQKWEHAGQALSTRSWFASAGLSTTRRHWRHAGRTNNGERVQKIGRAHV